MGDGSFLTISALVAEHLRGKILRGHWKEMIPGIHQLEEELGVGIGSAGGARIRPVDHVGKLTQGGCPVPAIMPGDSGDRDQRRVGKAGKADERGESVKEPPRDGEWCGWFYDYFFTKLRRVDQFWVTFTSTNNLAVAVPVTVAVTVVMPKFVTALKLTVVLSPSVWPSPRKVARSFDQR